MRFDTCVECDKRIGFASAVGLCEPCIDHFTEAAVAERYAVACIIYYGNGGDTGMSDARFDGFCAWLLGRQAWKRFPYLERGMLAAGSGYDLAKFPKELHEKAATEMGQPCGCQACGSS